MKPYLFVFLVFAVSCTSTTATQESTSDSTTAATDSLTVQEAVTDVQSAPESPEGNGTQLDSAWLTAFANHPLGSDPYLYLSGTLQGKGASFSGDSLNGNSEVVFGNSKVSIYTAEAYGSIVCSIDIDTPEIPLEKGVNVGMSREDFLSTSGIPASFLKAESDDKEYFEFNLTYEDNTSTRTVFWVDKKSLIRVEYAFTPCIIYD